MKISGLGGICHMSDVTDVKISGGEVTFRALDTVARGLRSQLEGQEARVGLYETGGEARVWELMRTFCEVCEHFRGEPFH